jgi:hypothetical protein
VAPRQAPVVFSISRLAAAAPRHTPPFQAGIEPTRPSRRNSQVAKRIARTSSDHSGVSIVEAATLERPPEAVQARGRGGGRFRWLDGRGKALGGPGVCALRPMCAVEVFSFANYDLRLVAWKSCLKSLRPPVSGKARIFFRNALRRSSFASSVSSSGCLAATTAPIYFTKLIPHFSHFTPVRCLLPQEGQSKRIVMWQRWQNRATSRTAAPHFGQGIVACAVGGAVGSQAFAGPFAFARASLLGDPA